MSKVTVICIVAVGVAAAFLFYKLKKAGPVDVSPGDISPGPSIVK